MKSFRLRIYKGLELKDEKVVNATSQKELNIQKNIFWSESPYFKSNPRNCMMVYKLK